MSEISVLLVGDAERSEFREASATLDALGHVTRVANTALAETALRDGRLVPEVIVLAQAYPAQFSHASVDRLRRLAPLARILGMMGSWCEGEMRTGKPWPAALRIYWHQWTARCTQQFDFMRRDECSAWGLPITATEEEQLLMAAERPIEPRQGLIALFTRRYEMEDWLSAACRARRYSTVWLRPPRPARIDGATAAIFDGSDCRGDELAALKRLATTLGPLPRIEAVPVIALLDFPRIEDQQRALSAGAAALMSKPTRVDDLFWQLDQVVANTG